MPSEIAHEIPCFIQAIEIPQKRNTTTEELQTIKNMHKLLQPSLGFDDFMRKYMATRSFFGTRGLSDVAIRPLVEISQKSPVDEEEEEDEEEELDEEDDLDDDDLVEDPDDNLNLLPNLINNNNHNNNNDDSPPLDDNSDEEGLDEPDDHDNEFQIDPFEIDRYEPDEDLYSDHYDEREDIE